MKAVLWFVFFLPLAITACSGTRPAHLGIKEGRLAPCPESPNCVSTQSGDTRHRIAPLEYKGSQAQAREKLLRIISGMPRSRIITETPCYIHAEFRSRFFRFVDDGEFHFEDLEKVIQFRSSSRIGYSDLGVNRKRMETIREKFARFE